MERRSITWLHCLILIAVLAAGSGFIADNAYATNGYFAHGYSIESKALGGAGVALPQGSLDASVNPALMAFVGKRLDVSLSLFNPNREYTVRGAATLPGESCPPDCPFGLDEGTVKSDSKFFLVPAIGANWSLNDQTSVGISIFGNGGMNTDYDKKTYESPYLPSNASSPTGIDMMQLFIVPTLSVKVTPKHALGFSPIIAYQVFEAKGLQNFSPYSSAPTKLFNNGHDDSYGFGARIGYYGELTSYLSIGASYQTKIWMSRLKDYAGLFAEQGDFDIPSNWTIGVAVKPTPALAFLFDVQKIYYSDVKSVNNRLIPGVTLVPGALGEDWGAGFGWEDMTIYKMGVQWKSSEDWTWRAGYSFGDQPIPSSEMMFNILAPGVVEQHATVGFTKAISKTQDLSFSLMHAFSHTISGNNALDTGQKISLKMNQWEGTIGYTWKF